MKKKNIKSDLLLSAFHRWQELPRRDKSAFVQTQAEMFQTSYGTIYRRFNELKNNDKVIVKRRSDTGTSRLFASNEEMMKHLRVVAGMRQISDVGQGGKPLSNFDCQQMAYNMPDGNAVTKILPASTLNRLLKETGLNYQSYQRPTGSVPLGASQPNSVLMVDATVADQFYLRPVKKGYEIFVDNNLKIDTSHRDDRIRKQGFQKIWIYCAVDLFSKAYMVMAFAGEKLGENLACWTEFIRYCLLAKKTSPIYGLPKMIFSDKGSALKSGAFGQMAEFFNIELVNHMPGNPRAKGAVERRIGAIKQGAERRLALLPKDKRPSEISEFNSFLQAHSLMFNEKKGSYKLWKKNLQDLVVITSEDFDNSLTMRDHRTVNKFGKVSFKSIEYYVSHDLVGIKIPIFIRFDGSLVGKYKDKVYILDENKNQPIMLDKKEGRKFVETEEQILRAEAVVEGRKLQQIITQEDLLPKKSNVRHLPMKGETFSKQPDAPAQSYDNAELAWLYICHETGINRADIDLQLVEYIDKSFTQLLRIEGEIDINTIIKLINLLNKTLQIKENSDVAN